MDNIYQRYAAIKKHIAELEAERKQIEISLIDDIDMYEGRRRQFPIGTFSVSSRKTWRYSGRIDELKENLAIAKKREEQGGLATLEKETEFVMFTPKK